jgi:hypothetical protein
MTIIIIILIIVIVFLIRSKSSNVRGQYALKSNMSDTEIAEARAGEALLRGSGLSALGEMFPVLFKEALHKCQIQLHQNHPDIPYMKITIEVGSILYLAYFDGILMFPDTSIKEEIMNIFLQRQELAPEVQQRVSIYSYILDKRNSEPENLIMFEIGKAFADALGKHEDSGISMWGMATFYNYRNAILKALYTYTDIEMPEELNDNEGH